MGLGGYTQETPGVINQLNKYTTKSGKNRNSRNNLKKEQMGLAFTQTQDKAKNDKNKTKTKGIPIDSNVQNKISGRRMT